jgi:hypothetical protein
VRREIWPDNVIENEYGLIGNLLPRECEAQPNNLNFGGRATVDVYRFMPTLEFVYSGY